MKIYHGVLEGLTGRVTVTEGNTTRDLQPRNDLFNHGTGPFQWGQKTPGMSKLALAIFTHCLGDTQGIELYQRLKYRLLENLSLTSTWILTDETIREQVQQIRAVEVEMRQAARKIELEPAPIANESGGGVEWTKGAKE